MAREVVGKMGLSYLVSERVGMKEKDVGRVIDALVEEIARELGNGEEVRLLGFGKFSTRERAERKLQGGFSGERREDYVVPAHKVIHFKPYDKLKEAINGK